MAQAPAVGEDDRIAAVAVVVISVVVIGVALRLRRGRPEAARARAVWLMAHRWPLALVVGGGVMAVTGIGMVAHAALVERVEVDLAAMERGEALDGRYVVVEGFPRVEAVICRRTRGGEDCSTPITSTADGRRVAALIAERVTTPARGRWIGFVMRSDRAGLAARLGERGLTAVGDLVRVVPEDREARSRAGSWVALAGVGLLAVGVVWLRRARGT